MIYYLLMSSKRIFTKEMIEDLYKIGDKEFSEKWNISRRVVIKFRKENCIASFSPQHGTKRKIIDGVEHKWCPRGGGHWEKLDGFRKEKNRAGGYAGICIIHLREDAVAYYHKNNGLEKSRAWKKTENGKRCLRNTWRKKKAKMDNAYVKWDRSDESRAYEVFEHRCGYCREEIGYLSLEFDHYIPVSLGGKTEPKNMVPCCVKCNHGVDGKFKREPEEWIRFRFRDCAEEVISYVNNKLNALAVLGHG